jgi:GABA permease
VALGGVIGAGLFVGSGAVMNKWAGFTIGWLYWYFWAIVLAIEAVAGATILQRWLDAPVWVMSLVLMSMLTFTNLWSVKSYGEFEFWFASIKVAAIIVFIAIAGGWLLGIGGGDSPGLSNLTVHGGFFPKGAVAAFAGVVIVIFAFVGAEIVTIAAGESQEPERAVARAVNSVVGRKNEQVDRRERRAGGEEGDATLLLSGQPWVTLIALALGERLPRDRSGEAEVR